MPQFSTDDEGEALKHGASHSTADAMLHGIKFEVSKSVLDTLAKVTKSEDDMLRKYYGHTEAHLMGHKFERFKMLGEGEMAEP